MMRISTKALFGGGRNKEEAAKDRVKRYLGLARGLSEKIEASMLAIYERVLSINQVEVYAVKIESMEYFHGMLNKHRDLVERRVIRGEQIPVGEKVYSLFEPHTEWLYKGKSNKRVELGHNILVASDQWGFIVDHQVIERQADVSLSIPLAEESSKTFKKLRHKHSAVESDINRLEHHGLDRCLDKGLKAFKRYCALGVVAANLHKLGNVLQKKARKQREKLRKAA